MSEEKYKRSAISIGLKHFDSREKESSYMEVCEWMNGEGIDVCINDKERFSLTHERLEALVYLSIALKLPNK